MIEGLDICRRAACRPPISWQLLRRSGFDPERLVDPEGDPAPAPEEDQRLLCAGCGHHVTDETEAIEVESSHLHQRSNPAGITFVVGCYRSAVGAEIIGEPTDYYSWFSGLAWSYAQCGGCRSHLGWAFSSGAEEGFVALIQNRISRAS